MEVKSILEDVIQIKPTNKNNATHFAVCNDGKIRYLIALDGGKKRLIVNLSSYSKKLSLLMRMLDVIPLSLLRTGKLGYFVEVKFCDELLNYIDIIVQNVYKIEYYQWNMIVGTYDDKQKLVVQCFTKSKSAIYFKIGNKNSAKEMVAEIDFLKEKPNFHTFDTPEILESQLIDNKHQFNILVTKEFVGDKVESVFTDDIYKIFQEISDCNDFDTNKNNKVEEDIPYRFSHGDFAPWNLKLSNSRYVVFDWEHQGMRFYGFDLIHYVFQIENLLNGRAKEKAVEIAVTTLKEYDKDCTIEKETLKKLYFKECKKSY